MPGKGSKKWGGKGKISSHKRGRGNSTRAARDRKGAEKAAKKAAWKRAQRDLLKGKTTET